MNKKNVKALKTLALALIVGLPMLTMSCSDDEVVDNGGTDTVITDQSNATIESVDTLSLYEYWAQELANAHADNGEEDSAAVAEAKAQLARIDSMRNAYNEENGGNGNWNHGWDGGEKSYEDWDLKIYNIRYTSKDVNGNDISLSELIMMPLYENAKGYTLYCHGQIFTNYQRPTNFLKQAADDSKTSEMNLLVKQAGDDYRSIIVAPDFQGLGATHGDTYPCGNYDVLARQAIDGLEAAKAVIDQEKLCNFDDVWCTALLGYGEGASVALAAHQYMETHFVSSGVYLTARYHYYGSVLVDGIYDPETFVSQCVSDGKTYDPIYLTRLINSLCKTDNNLKGKYTAEDFIAQKLLDTNIVNFLNGNTSSLGNYVYDSLLPAAWKGNIDVYLPYRDNSSNSVTWEKYYKERYEKIFDGNQFSGYTGYDDRKEGNSIYRKSSTFLAFTKTKVFTYGEMKTNNGLYSFNGELHSLYMKASDVLNSAVIDYYNGKTLAGDDKAKCEALSKALAAHSQLNKKNWSPFSPLYFCYSNHERNLRPKALTTKMKSALPQNSLIRWRYTNLVLNSYNMKDKIAPILEKVRKFAWNPSDTHEESFY